MATKFLIAGFGSIGRRHLHNLLSLGEKDIILLRSHQSTLDDQELRDFTVETDLGAALDHNPDGVIIANPTALHLDIAIPAARLGCHILLEKPISNSMEQINLLNEIVKESGSRLLIGFQFRYHPGMLQIKEWIQEEVIGRIHYVRAHWGEYLPDWHPWEDYRQGYSARKDLGGGVLLTLSHPIDYLGWFFGEVDNVFGKISSDSHLKIEVEESVEATLQFKNGLIGGLSLNYLQRPPTHTLEIVGSEGTITWNNDGSLMLYKVITQAWEEYFPPDGFSRNDLFLAEMKHFIEVIDGQKPACNLDDGIQVQKIIEAIYQSAYDGKVVFL